MLEYLVDILICYMFFQKKSRLQLTKNKDLNSYLEDIPLILLYHLIKETYRYQAEIYLEVGGKMYLVFEDFQLVVLLTFELIAIKTTKLMLL